MSTALKAPRRSKRRFALTGATALALTGAILTPLVTTPAAQASNFEDHVITCGARTGDIRVNKTDPDGSPLAGAAFGVTGLTDLSLVSENVKHSPEVQAALEAWEEKLKDTLAEIREHDERRDQLEVEIAEAEEHNAGLGQGEYRDPERVAELEDLIQQMDAKKVGHEEAIAEIDAQIDALDPDEDSWDIAVLEEEKQGHVDQIGVADELKAGYEESLAEELAKPERPADAGEPIDVQALIDEYNELADLINDLEAYIAGELRDEITPIQEQRYKDWHQTALDAAKSSTVEVTTDENGVAVVEDVYLGIHCSGMVGETPGWQELPVTVQELDAPDGFQLDSTVYTVETSPDFSNDAPIHQGISELTVVNHPIEIEEDTPPPPVEEQPVQVTVKKTPPPAEPLAVTGGSTMAGFMGWAGAAVLALGATVLGVGARQRKLLTDLADEA